PGGFVHEFHDERRVVASEFTQPQPLGLKHAHGRAVTRASRPPSSARPSGHAPYPESVLMWPASPMSVNPAPQPLANSIARVMETCGSVRLATTCTGNGIGRRGMGANGRSSDGP